jgi:Na+/melibiose symporter-like transporter
VLGVLWLSLWSAFIPLLGPGHYWLFFLIMILKGSAIGALVFLPASMAADVVDLDTLRTGEQRTGLYFSLWGMVNKGAVAFGVLLATNGVALFGFDPSSAANSDQPRWPWRGSTASSRPRLACVALPLLWNYPLTRERQERMRGTSSAGISAARHEARRLQDRPSRAKRPRTSAFRGQPSAAPLGLPWRQDILTAAVLLQRDARP